MLQVTESARQAVKGFMEQNNLTSAIRVFQGMGGCSGPQLAIRVDEPAENDEQFEYDGQVYVVDKGLGLMAGGITLDFIEVDGRQGFTIETARPMGGSCDCGGSCGDGGSCC